MRAAGNDHDRVRIGYCTNVHPGNGLDDVLANLDEHASVVRQRLQADPATRRWTEPMDVGLWLPADAARRVRTEGEATWLREELAGRNLRAFTFNGFPYGDFHRRTVKHQVYRPGWDDPRRLAYTRDLVEIMARLHDAGADASISTVPITWRPWCTDGVWDRAISHLRLTALHAAEVERRTGVCVHVDLEPEPGCALDRSIDVVRLFEDRLLPGLCASDEAAVRRHLRVCHDSCHAAVMFDGQAASMDRLAAAGIGIGKVQVSSALDIDFSAMDREQRAAALEHLGSFAEPRYLHQVSIRRRGDGPVDFVEDLPAALASTASGDGAAELGRQQWRVHFHVPVHVERVGPLGTTQGAIDDCLAAAARHGVRHLEVETYAWSVLPESMQPERLADGIAAELAWVLQRPGITGLGVTPDEVPSTATRAGRAEAMARMRGAALELDVPGAGAGAGASEPAVADDEAAAGDAATPGERSES